MNMQTKAFAIHTLTDVSSISDNKNNRMAKIRFKENRKTGEKRENKFVELPRITIGDIENNFDTLAPHFISYLESQQDALARTFVESGVSAIPADDISIGAVIAYLDAMETGGRLTKEAISAWFDANMAGEIGLSLAEKLGITDIDSASPAQIEKMESVISAFRDRISALTSGRTNYPIEVATKLRDTIARFVDSSDTIAGRLISRLEKMIASPVSDDDLLSAL